MSKAAVLEPRHRERPAAQLQAAARDAFRQAAANGEVPTGAELGRSFGRSERWGRERIAECRAAADGTGTVPVPQPVAEDGSGLSRFGIDGNGDGRGAAAGLEPAGSVAPPVGADSHSGGPEATWSRRFIRWITTAAVLVVAACAARSSYEHQRTVVEMAGNHEAAWYLPLSVDGMMLIASLNMLVRRWDGESAGWLTWTALLLGGAASLAANIAAAPPTWIGRLVAAWSPLCLVLSYELLMQQLPSRTPATPS
jgi:hypothetical protein